MAVTEGAFFSTPVMQEVLMDMQVKTIESFGVNITDQMYDRMEQGHRTGGLHDAAVAGDRHPDRRGHLRRHHPGHLGHVDGRDRHLQAGLRHPRPLRRHLCAVGAVRDAPQLRHAPHGGRQPRRLRADARRDELPGAVPRRHRPLLRVVVDQRRHRRGRAVQAEDRRHRRHVRRTVCGGAPWCSPSCGQEIN